MADQLDKVLRALEESLRLLDRSAPSPALEREKAIHNERVKLNANFFNSLAVWFAGAGAAGVVINTTLATEHNFIGAGEIGLSGVGFAIVLKLLANREIGKLR